MSYEGFASEGRLLAGYRLRMVRLANAVGWVAIISIFLYTFLHPGHQEMTSHLIIWALLALAGLANIATHSKRFLRLIEAHNWRILFYVWCVLLILFASLMVYLSRESAGEVYLIYFPIILFASGVLDPKGQVVMTVLAMLSYFGIAYPTVLGELDKYLMRFAGFLVVGIVGSYIAREHRREVARHAYQERQARKRAYQLASLSEMASAMASELGLQRLLEKVAQMAHLFIGAEAGMLLVEARGDESSPYFIASTQTTGPRREDPPQNEAFSRVLESGKPLRLTLEEASSMSLSMPSRCSPIRNLLVVPLILRGEVAGCLSVANKLEEDDFAQEDEALLSTLSAQAAVAIENSRLFSASERERLKLQAVVDVLSDGLVTADADLRIVSLNPAAERLLGWRAEEAVGRPCYAVMNIDGPEGTSLCQRACPAQKALGGDPLQIDSNLAIRKKDGRLVICRVNTGVLRSDSGGVATIIHALRDVTEEERMKGEMLQQNQELFVLNVVANALSRYKELNEMLSLTLETVIEVMRVDAGAIFLLDKKAQELTLKVHQGLSTNYVEGVRQLKVGEGIAGEVALKGEPVVVENIAADPRLTRAVVKEEGLRSFASIPLKAKDEVLGVMNVATRRERPFTPQELRLLTSIGSQIAVAISNLMLYEEVQLKEELRGELLKKVITAQEEERKRVARELHDEAGQALSTVIVGIGTAENALPVEMSPLREQMARIKSLMSQALGDIRKLILDLRPTVLDDLGLVAALRWYVKSHLEDSGVQVSLETRGLSKQRFPPELEIALFRIAQEAINNIAKHAGASHARLRLELEGDAVLLEVEDNGRGFDLREVRMSRDRARGLGILGMEERVTLFGGRFHIESQPGRGTRIRIEVPLGGGR